MLERYDKVRTGEARYLQFGIPWEILPKWTFRALYAFKNDSAQTLDGTEL